MGRRSRAKGIGGGDQGEEGMSNDIWWIMMRRKYEENTSVRSRKGRMVTEGQIEDGWIALNCHGIYPKVLAFISKSGRGG